MQTEKISISLAASLVQFIENYKITKKCKSRSQVIELALDCLRFQELQEAYPEASTEINQDWELPIRYER
jgi:metal-responsive CopG/Arc/MetJ family transcriptional regulator